MHSIDESQSQSFDETQNIEGKNLEFLNQSLQIFSVNLFSLFLDNALDQIIEDKFLHGVTDLHDELLVSAPVLDGKFVEFLKEEIANS